MKLMVDGQEAYAYTGGKPFDPALPCVVFVHGAVGDHTAWTLLARWAAHHGYAALAVDLPGHMRSAGPALASVEDLAAWTLALLDAAGVQRASFVGHSLGSLVALQAAATAPERAEALLMIGTAVPMPVPQPLLDLSLTDVGAAIDRIIGFSFASLASKPSYPGPGVWLQGAARALMHQVMRAGGDPRLFHTDFSACNAYTDGLAMAERVRCPATLLLGERDQMTLPRGAREVAQRLKAAVQTLPLGHFLMAEAPDGVLNVLRGALAARRAPESAAGAPA